MLVTQTNFHNVLQEFVGDELYGLDTECSGLKESDRLFSLILSNSKGEFYFNFWPYPDAPEEAILPREWLKHLQHPFNNLGATWAMSDAKFDMRMLWYEGLEIHGKVWCIQAQERVLFNDLFPAESEYGLARMAERRGLKKDDAVEDYITKHKLWTTEVIPGKKQVAKNKEFYRVPLNIIQPYAEMDAKLARVICLDQMKAFSEIQVLPGQPSPMIVSENEQRLTKTLLKVERYGIRLNVPFTQDAFRNETVEIERATKEFEEATGIKFNDGRVCLVEAFTKLGEAYPTTAKGNPSFTEDVLEGMSTPVASMVNRIRKHTKRANTYYSSYLFFQQDGFIHANYRQAGTDTGRLSCHKPNMQNCPKENDDEDKDVLFPVRGCFIPRSPDHCFVSLDFDQMEYRLLVDYAGEMGMVDAINSGVDVHTATAELVGNITRKQAKTLNFLLLYGGGVEKLAAALGISFSEASSLREKYFSKLPKVQQLIKNIMFSGKNRGYIWNHFGRRLNLKSWEFAYALPNHLIQGTGGETNKHSLNLVQDLLSGTKSGIVANIHDEILIDMHKDDFHLIDDVKTIMESVYIPRNGLRLTVGCDHSWKSWAYRDFTKGKPWEKQPQ